MGRIGRRNRRRDREADADRPEVRVRTGPQDGRRMSEVLHEVAEPLLDGLRLPEHQQELEVALNIGAAAWNASLLEWRRKRGKALAEVKKSLRHPGAASSSR